MQKLNAVFIMEMIWHHNLCRTNTGPRDDWEVTW